MCLAKLHFWGGGDRRGNGSVPTPRPEVLRGAATIWQGKLPNCGSQGPPKRDSQADETEPSSELLQGQRRRDRPCKKALQPRPAQ